MKIGFFITSNLYVRNYINSGILKNLELQYNIDFPLENLDMSKYVTGYSKSKYKYDLISVSNHAGGCNSGHYFAYCKNADKKWYKFDDNVVSTSADISSKIVSSKAYCLFYILK